MRNFGMLWGVLLFGCLESLLAPLSQAQTESEPWQIGGRIFSDHYAWTENRGTFFAQNSLSTWLEATSPVWNDLQFNGVISQTVFFQSLESPTRTRGEFTLRESYLTFNPVEGLEFRLGQQIIPWGKSDGVNPTDFWTAKDLTFFNPDEEVRRTGALSLNILYTPENGSSPISFQWITQLNRPQSRLLVPDSAVQNLPVAFQRNLDRTNGVDLDRIAFGGKTMYTGSNFDLSLSFFRGFTTLPVYIFENGIIQPSYPRLTGFGSDGSMTAGNYVLRYETAALLPDNGRPNDPRFGQVQPWHWDSTFGIERPIGDDFRIQTQLLYRHHFFYPAVLTPGLGQANALILNYQDRSYFGATFRFAYQPTDHDWGAEFFLIGYGGTGNSFLMRPTLTYSPIENLQTQIGADLYGGDSSRTLGALKNLSAVFVELKYLY